MCACACTLAGACLQPTEGRKMFIARLRPSDSLPEVSGEKKNIAESRVARVDRRSCTSLRASSSSWSPPLPSRSSTATCRIRCGEVRFEILSTTQYFRGVRMAKDYRFQNMDLVNVACMLCRDQLEMHSTYGCSIDSMRGWAPTCRRRVRKTAAAVSLLALDNLLHCIL